MTLRTIALIAGVLGLLLLIAGLVADAMRPEGFGTPRAQVDTAVVVIGPDEVAIAPGGSITVEGQGEIVAYAGRGEDVEAWAASREVTVITGVPTWDELSTQREEPAPSPEPTAGASVSAEPTPSASASASASPSAEPAADPTADIDDIWRTAWSGSGSLEISTASIPVGLTVVVESVDGVPLSATEMLIYRAVDDNWVSPLKWWGAVLAAFGLIALISLVIDMRGARSRVESSVASRKATEPARPGSRRERRETATATGGIPVVAEPTEPWTGEVPRVGEDDAPAADPAPQDDDPVPTHDVSAEDDAPDDGGDDGEERP